MRLKEVLPIIPDKFHFITNEGVFCNFNKKGDITFPVCMLEKDEVVSITVHKDGLLVLKLKTVE